MDGTRIRSRQCSIAVAGRFRSAANYVLKNTRLGCSLYHHRRSPASVGEGIKVITVCDDNLAERDVPRRAKVATELRWYSRIKNCMETIFTVNDKWCLHVNIKHSSPRVDKEEQHEQPKASLHPLEDMISTWCDCEGHHTM
ncbi:hypothetical protein Y032_0058g2877 [Ancylostoma ceylanicum]|uniref:Uncharacterized protein n=1 Tax=Ancylostoma ceylanicum TaxID=53326 RepID=A0A016U4X4_9BILA|nr:hypothetical protein Y032_0058g2877 [Ancylostoma ceylanicum]